MQNEVEKYNNLTKKEFNVLYKNYKWLSCLDLHNKPWTEKEFKEIITSFKKLQQKKTIPFTEIAKNLYINQENLEYLQMAKRFVYIKDARDDFRRKGVNLVLPFFAEIAKRMNIQRQDISYVQSSEVIDFLEHGTAISQSTITDRKKGFVMYLDDRLNIVCLQTKPIIAQALTMFNLQIDDVHPAIISGRTACNGIAKGTVAIIHGVKDLRKVQQGSILVAVTTHPDYTAVMRKAAAIITDEGGITSHAAIVAREYGIPCIVGTHNATKILKDGDTIEVNATEGRVKKVI